MIYMSIILTVFVVLVLLTLWGAIPNKAEMAEIRKEQKEHNEYQIMINNKMIEMHKDMIVELRYIGNNLQ